MIDREWYFFVTRCFGPIGRPATFLEPSLTVWHLGEATGGVWGCRKRPTRPGRNRLFVVLMSFISGRQNRIFRDSQSRSRSSSSSRAGRVGAQPSTFGLYETFLTLSLIVSDLPEVPQGCYGPQEARGPLYWPAASCYKKITTYPRICVDRRKTLLYRAF